jgi:exonuclease SbcC
MIPIKLVIHNFMCYRDSVPPLYFDSIHTACISGDNGNGKSALIDALTWALWGKARAKNDDELIHQGEAEMGVELDFHIEQQIYRVLRKRARPKRRRAAGQTILELQIASDQGFRPISGSSIHETQGKITGILHMDYETFINSAFLRQGHADEFTIKRPVERKEVLADILGLAIYDELEERAKELAKGQETERAQLESAIKDIDDELAGKPDYEASFDQAQAELTRIGQLVNEQESRLNQRRQQRESLENKRQQLQQLEEHMAETKSDINRWQEQVSQYQTRIKEYEEIIARRADIEEGYARFADAKKLADEYDRKLAQWAGLSQRQHQLEMAIERAQAALIGEHRLAESRIGELEDRYQKLATLRSEISQLEQQQRQLAQQEEALRSKKQTAQDLQAEASRLELSTAGLEREIAEIGEKLKMLLDQGEARCPLCETELGMDGIKLIEAKYSAERDGKSASLNTNRAELGDKKKQVASLQAEINQMEEGLGQARASFQSQASVLRKEVSDAEAAGRQLNTEREKLAELEQRLARKDFAMPEQQALAKLEDELAGLDYDSGRHEEIRQRLVSLRQYEKPKQELEEADSRIEQARQDARKAEEAARQRRQSLEEEDRKRQQLASDLEALPRLEEELAQVEAEYQELTGQQRQAQETFWGIKAKLERCAELEKKKKEKTKQLGQASKEQGIYRDLAQAFGKRGIQAMLIETALPEIEVEANNLLARMTDNRMHVKIETQRETKKGDLRETLDINIADELGTRSYEMFSGGEAFRINFAIRVALSKLLARRAGAPLRTLIIDEGFGTQDSYGIEKIKEAISSIQDDFDKILVITHITEFRDAFPTRIDVIKTAEGSTIEVR